LLEGPYTSYTKHGPGRLHEMIKIFELFFPAKRAACARTAQRGPSGRK
jgi:hypothetical protein